MKQEHATTFIGAIFLIGSFVLFMSLVWTFFASGDCVSTGGSYDYSLGRCDSTSNHPFLPFYRDWTFWLAVGSFIFGTLIVGRDTDGHEA